MIARVWRGAAQGRTNADAYLRHLDASGVEDFVRHYEVER